MSVLDFEGDRGAEYDAVTESVRDATGERLFEGEGEAEPSGDADRVGVGPEPVMVGVADAERVSEACASVRDKVELPGLSVLDAVTVAVCEVVRDAG